MLESKYSAPEFNIFGESDKVPDDGSWPAPVADAPLDATLSLPGSKSLTNRELVLAALADGESLLRAPLHSMDSRNMVDALRALGATIDELPGAGPFGADWRVTPGELFGSTTIDCGLAARNA
jgi:3-phosphoshikimate 1-carboxyvinyltransferase